LSSQLSTQPSTPDESSPISDNSGRKLIDIEFADFGREILSIVDSMTFIPEKFVKKIRAIYTLYMKKIISDKLDKTNWKKFLLLPTVLFTDGKPRGSRKGELTRIIRDLENDSWNQLTVEYFTAKKLPTETNVTILEENSSLTFASQVRSHQTTLPTSPFNKPIQLTEPSIDPSKTKKESTKISVLPSILGFYL
jgi:hypothetical protein